MITGPSVTPIALALLKRRMVVHSTRTLYAMYIHPNETPVRLRVMARKPMRQPNPSTTAWETLRICSPEAEGFM